MLTVLRDCVVTLTVAVVVIVVFCTASLPTSLQLDFAAVTDGQWWRIWTGHLTHFGLSHLFWDLIMFVILGCICERGRSAHFAVAIAAITAGISAFLAIARPEINVYRGLSGLDTGLFVCFVVDQLRGCWREADHVLLPVWLIALAGLFGKLVFEVCTGTTLFVDSSAFLPLVESHLAGAALGLVCGLCPEPRRIARTEATILKGKRSGTSTCA